MALEPEAHPHDDLPDVDLAALHEVHEVDDDAVRLQALQVSENAELRAEGRAPPTAWRLDRFDDGQEATTPPWSLRPPAVRPAEWTMMNKQLQIEGVINHHLEYLHGEGSLSNF